MERHTRGEQPCAAAAEEQPIELPVEHDQDDQRTPDEPGFPPQQSDEEQDGRCGGDTMRPAEVERRPARTVLEHKPQPWHAPPEQIRLRHAHERPLLEVLSLNSRVEENAFALRVKAHAELDVLYGWEREASFVESAEVVEDVAPDRAEPGPEGGRDSGVLLVDVVVEQVAEVGDNAGRPRFVIVGAKDRRQIRVVVKGAPYPNEDVFVHLDVGIDEDQDVPARLPGRKVACGRRPEVAGLFDDDQLLGSRRGAPNRGDNALKGHSPIGGGDDDTKGDHNVSVGSELLVGTDRARLLVGRRERAGCRYSTTVRGECT